MADREQGFDFQPYITPYTGSPVKEFETLGKVLNERYEKNLTEWDNADFVLNSIKTLDGGKEFKQKARTDIDNTMKSIIESGRYEDAKPYVREVVKRLRNDSNLTTAQENYKKAMELEAKVADMTLKGKTPLSFRDYKKEQKDEDGNLMALNTTGAVEEQLDYHTKMQQFFDGVQPDGHSNSSSAPDVRNGMIFQVGSGSSATYISKEKIQQLAKNSVPTFINTDEGRQRMRVLTEKGGYEPQEALKVIEQELASVGMERAFNRSESQSSVQFDSGMTNRLFGDPNAVQPPAPSNQQMEQNEIKRNVVNPEFKSLSEKLSPEGNKVGRPTTDRAIGAAGVGAPGIRTETAGGKWALDKLTGKEFKTIEKIAETLGIKTNDNKYTPYELSKIRKFAEEKMNTGISVTTRTFTEEEINKAKNYAANGNYRGRQFFDLETQEFVSYAQLPKDVKAIFDSGKASEIQFSGVFDTDNPFYDAATASKAIKNPNGWISPENISVAGRNYAVSSSLSDKNKDDIRFRELANQISRANRQGLLVNISNGSDREKIVPLGNGLYELRDKDNKPIFDGVFTKEQLAAYANQYNFNVEKD